MRRTVRKWRICEVCNEHRYCTVDVYVGDIKWGHICDQCVALVWKLETKRK